MIYFEVTYNTGIVNTITTHIHVTAKRDKKEKNSKHEIYCISLF